MFAELQDFKERFEKGEGDIQVQKAEIDIHAGDLNGIKSAFEKVGTTNLFKSLKLIDKISVTLLLTETVRCNYVGNRKRNANFQGEDNLEMTLEERAELKKKQIDEEFLRYKLVRRAAAQREAVKEVHQLSAF